MVTYKIHLLRHALTAGNLEGRYIGRTDLCLCEEGRDQLRRLQRHYTYPPAEMVVVSPLQRCIETADILYPETYIEQWPAFIELDFGAFEGKSAEDLKDEPAFEKWLSGEVSAPPNGESAQDVTARVAMGLDRLFRRMMDEKMQAVTLITHGGIITTLLYGMGLPKRSLQLCSVGSGRGYTLLMTPQLWMRDRVFEIYGVAPYGLTESGVRGEAPAGEEDAHVW